MTYVYRAPIAFVAALGLLFAGVAVAQDDLDPIHQSQENCEAAGGEWVVNHDPPLGDVWYCDVAVAPAAEPAPAQPAPAQQAQPQYTG